MITKYYSDDQIEKNEMGGACSRSVGEERCIQGFGGETCGKRQLESPRCRWEDNIKTDLHDVKCGDTNWIDLAQDRDSWRALVKAVRNIRVP
jgi:hypothetical protein